MINDIFQELFKGQNGYLMYIVHGRMNFIWIIFLEKKFMPVAVEPIKDWSFFRGDRVGTDNITLFIIIYIKSLLLCIYIR